MAIAEFTREPYSAIFNVFDTNSLDKNLLVFVVRIGTHFENGWVGI